jgi:hypothetical protein
MLHDIRLNGNYAYEKSLQTIEHQNTKIQELTQEVEKGKHTKEKSGIVYIAGNAKEKDRDIYKVGETINEKKRVSTMNTCESDNCFIIYQSFETNNRKLAEKLIHAFLDNQNYKYNKEFYNIKLNNLITVVHCFTTFVNQLKDDDIFHSLNDIIVKLQTNLSKEPTTIQQITIKMITIQLTTMST